MQAGYTDFHYLRPIWRKTTEEDALIGVGLTGIASNAIANLNLQEAAYEVLATNERVAERININVAARTTTVKPAGTSSLVLGSSSGIHAWHAPYYIRRVRLGKNEAIYQYLSGKMPELVEDDYFNPNKQAVISIPQEAPEGATFRDESCFDLFWRADAYNEMWVRAGHRRGDNFNNVSCTLSVKDGEWHELGCVLYNERDKYNGMSVLPYDGGTYKQTPFEDCSKEAFEQLSKHLTEIDLSEVKEVEDVTDLSGEAACAGGRCEVV